MGKNHFEERLIRSFIGSSVRTSSLPARKWDEGFLTKVREEGKKDGAYERAKKQEAEAGELAPKDRKTKELSCENDLLYQRNLLWIPKGLIQKVIESEHDTKVTGHMGQDKTIELI